MDQLHQLGLGLRLEHDPFVETETVCETVIDLGFTGSLAKP